MSTVTINIKNNNCGCCGDSGSPAAYTGLPDYNSEGADPNNATPPEGYTSAVGSSLLDRQCKMAVFIYAWLISTLDFLATTSQGSILLGIMQQLSRVPGGGVLSSVIQSTAGKIAAAVIVFIPTAAVWEATLGAPIPGPVDGVVVGILSGLISTSMLSVAGKIVADIWTQPYMQNLISLITPYQDDLICSLASSNNATDARARVVDVIDDLPDLQPDDEVFILALIPQAFLTILFFKPDWWPSFDDDILSNITTSCCGEFTQDAVIGLGDQARCQASWYILDKLRQSLLAYYNISNIGWGTYSFNDVYSWLSQNYSPPAKIKNRANSYEFHLYQLTEIIYTDPWILSGNAKNYFDDLAAYIETNETTLAAALQTAADPAAAYTTLQPLRDWITDPNAYANEGRNISAAQQQYFLGALDGLIAVRDDNNGILDLLFRQDVDLAFFAVDKCGATGSDYYLTAVTAVNILKTFSEISSEAQIIGVEDSADDTGGMLVQSGSSQIFGEVEGDFGQVYADSIKLEVRVRGQDASGSDRNLESAYCYIKENIGDEWFSVGQMYFNQASLDNNGVWQWRSLSFAARPVRYVKLRFNRGTNPFGKYGTRYFDAVKLSVESGV